MAVIGRRNFYRTINTRILGRFNLETWDDPTVTASRVEAGSIIEEVSVEAFFGPRDNSGWTPGAALEARDWAGIISQILQAALFPEEPNYGQSVYDEAEEIEAKRRTKSSSGGIEVSLAFRGVRHQR